MPESYPGNIQTLDIDLPQVSDTGINIFQWDVNTSEDSPDDAQFGTIAKRGTNDYELIYTPINYNENQDSFIWEAKLVNGTVERYQVIIDIVPVNNAPAFGSNGHNKDYPSANLPENTTTSEDLLVYVIDFDSNATRDDLTLSIQEDPSNLNDHHWFTTSRVDSLSSGNTYCFRISSTETWNFEANPPKNQFIFDLVLEDDGGNQVVEEFTVNITNEPEDLQVTGPQDPITGDPSLVRNLNEDENTEDKDDYVPLEFSAIDPDGSDISWKFRFDNSHIGGTVKLNGVTLTEDDWQSGFDSGEIIKLDYEPLEDAFGQQKITLYAKADNQVASTNIVLTFNIAGVYGDELELIDVNGNTISHDSTLGENGIIPFPENGTGTVYDFDPYNPDTTTVEANRIDYHIGSEEGALLIYTISGDDESLFEIDETTGFLTFLSPPNYEDKLDSNQDNVYEITVTIQDRSGEISNLVAAKDYISFDLKISVQDEPESPTFSADFSDGPYQQTIQVEEDNTWTWNSVTMFDLIATDEDADETELLTWSIIDQDLSAGEAFISGSGQTPDSFTYVPEPDYDGTNGDGSFTLLVVQDPDPAFPNSSAIEIDFVVEFTPVSDPAILTSVSPSSLETISKTNFRYTFNLNENNPIPVRLDFEEADGQVISDIDFKGGSNFLDNEHFALDVTGLDSEEAFVEISFSGDMPDYENPYDDDEDNNYSIYLEVKESSNKSLYLYLDFNITDVDDAAQFVTDNFSLSVQENQTNVTELSGSDQDGADTFYWKIIPTDDYLFFELDVNESTSSPTCNLSFKSAPDYENPMAVSGTNSYVVHVKISETQNGAGTTEQFTVTVTDANDAPVFSNSTPSTIEITEGDLTNALMDLSQYVSDEDVVGGVVNTLTWKKVSGDSAAFSLNPNTGNLEFLNESYSDYETNPEYNLTVSVDDGNDAIVDRNFTIQLIDANEAPQFFKNMGTDEEEQITTWKFDLDEDSSYQFSMADYTRDPEASVRTVTVTYSYDSSIDYNGTFPIFGATSGVIKFVPDANFVGINYLTVTATDEVGANAELKIEFHVADVSDAPIIRLQGTTTELTTTITRNIVENNNWELDLTSLDLYDDPPADSLSWTLGGVDSSKFKITPSEGNDTKLILRSPPNFEEPDDTGEDNQYEVTVIVTDDHDSANSFNLELNYGDEDEYAIFDYEDSDKFAGEFDEASIHPNVFRVEASDIDLASSGFRTDIVYGFTPSSIFNDNGIAAFSIDSDTGVISIISEDLDFEDPKGTVDSNPNTYVLEVFATTDISDPSQEITHRVFVTIVNVVEPPYFDAGNTLPISINENESGLTLIDADTEDDGSTIELEISGGNDQELFTLNVATKELSFTNPPDFEDPKDSGSDNSYEVQVRIVGTDVTQDITFSVQEANDDPVITNTGLTQLIVDENTGFVVDIDVSDQDSEAHHYDLLYHTSDQEIRYFSHTGDYSSLSDSYTTGSWTDVDDTLSPSFILHGDFNKDGYEDIILLEKSDNEIRHLEYQYNSISSTFSFVEQTPLCEDNPPSNPADGVGPFFALANDLDQDGDLDVVVSFVGDTTNDDDKIVLYKNDGSGSFSLANSPLWASDDITATGQEIVHFAIGDLDGDSYNDLVIARRTGNNGLGRVSLLLNHGTGSATFESEPNVDFGVDLGIVKPSYIELADMDGSGALDILVAGEDAITLLNNNGMGTNDKLSVISKKIGQFEGDGFQVKAHDLTGNGLMDIVYTTGDFNSDDGIRSRVKILKQDAAGVFTEPSQLLPLHIESNKALYRPEGIRILPETSGTRTSIIFTDGATGYLTLYEARSTNDGTFEDPVILAGTTTPESGSTIESILLVDLGRHAETFTYELSGGDDKGQFDATRFSDEGKLYFNELPDYEDPTDDGTDNFYEVTVKVEDDNGGSTTQKVTVYVKDVNDDPVISSSSNYPDPTGSSPSDKWAFPLKIFENTVGEIALVSATNDEKGETVSFSISRGLDSHLFDIDEVTGSLTFLSAPDYETPLDNGADNFYEVIVKATDSGTNPGYDEQNITIEIEDGAEPPSFDSNTSTTYVISEDTTLWSHVIIATDDAGNKPSSGLAANPFSISTDPASGVARFDDTNNSFYYSPYSDFYGTDTFMIRVTNITNKVTDLEITVEVKAVNDPPKVTFDSIYDISESQQNISILSANDDSLGDLSWSWSDPGFSDTVFSLSSSGELKFRNADGIDFDNPLQNAESFLPTDATNLLLWLDADDNSTLFANSNPSVSALAATTVGRWQDKSGMDHNFSQLTADYRPLISHNQANGLSMIDFDGVDKSLKRDSLLGLDSDPNILVFLVSQIDANNSTNDQIFSLGDPGAVSLLTGNAGSDGWSWGNGVDFITFDEVPTLPGLQVWERSSGDSYSDSKFYLNGEEQVTSSTLAGFPNNNSQEMEIGSATFDGKIGEFIVLNSTDLEDRQKLEGYLAHKWGLSHNLPTTHPYKYKLPEHIKWERSVRVTDPDGGFTDGNLTIRVVNDNDNAPVINNPQLQGTTKILHSESSLLVMDLNITDLDGDNLEYEIVGGVDRDFFLDKNFSESSVLAFASRNDDPDFPAFDNRKDLPKGFEDNIYEVEIEIRDGDPTHTISLALQVEIVKPYITVGGIEQIGGEYSLGIKENNASVLLLDTSDLWDNNVTFTTIGGNGASQDLFEVNATNNLLRFIYPPNFEDPQGVEVVDGNGNNIPSNKYEVEVVAEDELGYQQILKVTVNVQNVNEPPGLTKEIIYVNEDSSWEGTVEVSDPEDPDAIFEFKVKSYPERGVLTENDNGTFKYQPDNDYFGEDQMIVSVKDDTIVQDYVLTFVVNPIDDNPLAVDDVFTYKLSYGDHIEFDVLENDSNMPDSDDSFGLIVASFDQPTYGQVSMIDDEKFKYTPSGSFFGLDSFQYTLEDSAGKQSKAMVFIVVHEVESIPNWRFLKNIGFYSVSMDDWIYHNDLGWVYLAEPTKLESVTWMWQKEIGWFWTGESYAPDAYFNDFNAWFTFTSNDTASLTWPIYNQEAEEWLNQDDFNDRQFEIVMQKVANDIAPMSVEEKVIYIDQSNDFTDDQKNAIKYELLFEGFSRTLTFLTAGVSK